MNRNKLKGVIRENCLSQEDLAEKMGISLSRMNAKINGRREAQFTLSELRAMVECLHLDKDTFWKIFMTDN